MAVAAPQVGLALWVLRRDLRRGNGELVADYSVTRGVEPGISVDEFKALWARSKNIGIDSALITLSLVKCGRGRPDASDEAAAIRLGDPSATLLEAGLAPVSWLWADFDVALAAAPAPLAAVKSVVLPLLLALGRLGLVSTPRSPLSSSSSTTASSKSEQKRAQSALRTNALQAYGHAVTPSGELTCPVLRVALPAAAVTCAHLMPRKLRDHWARLGTDVDDPRNVMFMFKGIEEAFHDYLLSFLRTGGVDARGKDLFRVFVWDPALLDLPLTVNVRCRAERRSLPGVLLPECVEGITFRALHKAAPLPLAGPSGLSPFRRALALQAALAHAHARFNRWPEPPLDLLALNEPVSPDMSPDKEEHVREWRTAAADAAAAGAADELAHDPA